MNENANGVDTEVLGQDIFQVTLVTNFNEINKMILIGMIAMALNPYHQTKSLKISMTILKV